MSDNKDATRNRAKYIDDAVEAAEGSNRERDTPPLSRPPASANPYPKGSYRAKVWERNRQEGKYDKQ